VSSFAQQVTLADLEAALSSGGSDKKQAAATLYIELQAELMRDADVSELVNSGKSII